MAMSEAQAPACRKQARGEEACQVNYGLSIRLERRGSSIILSTPVAVLAWAVVSDDPTAMDKVKLFFEMFSQLLWFTNLWILA